MSTTTFKVALNQLYKLSELLIRSPKQPVKTKLWISSMMMFHEGLSWLRFGDFKVFESNLWQRMTCEIRQWKMLSSCHGKYRIQWPCGSHVLSGPSKLSKWAVNVSANYGNSHISTCHMQCIDTSLGVISHSHDMCMTWLSCLRLRGWCWSYN